MPHESGPINTEKGKVAESTKVVDSSIEGRPEPALTLRAHARSGTANAGQPGRTSPTSKPLYKVETR